MPLSISTLCRYFSEIKMTPSLGLTSMTDQPNGKNTNQSPQ